MKILKVFILSSVLLLASGIATAAEETLTAEIEEIIALDEDVTAEDLDIQEPKLLPSNPFYFLKTWGREIQSAFTFNPVKKAELRKRFANEKLIELKKVVERTERPEAIKRATDNYQAEVVRVKKAVERIKQTTDENPEVNKFLDKHIQQQILHYRLLTKLEGQVPAEAFAKIKEAREAHLEKFGEVMVKLETKIENIGQRLEDNIKKIKGSEFKDFKNLEILDALAEKLPEKAREAVQKVQANTLLRLKDKVEQISPEKLDDFNAYTESISGVKERQIRILESLRGELKASPMIGTKLIETRDRIIENIRTEEKYIGCPQIEKPLANFCKDGRVIVRKNDEGCVIGFSCIKPEQTGACIDLWDPVCGKNGKTYSNKCYAEQADIDVAYRGACKKTECRQDTDCPKSRCTDAQSKCFNGECIVPRCTISSQSKVDCKIDSDCACGVKKGTDECFVGNKDYVDTANQCPDFCTGFGGDLIIRCVENKCQQQRDRKLPTEDDKPEINIFQKNIIDPIKRLFPTTDTTQ